MILSVSRRTDIPAFYSEWFFQRLKEGFVCVRNPMSAHQVSRIQLSPETTDCIVFWTKDPGPMLPRLEELRPYAYYFQYTLNSYGSEVEPHVPPLDQRLGAFAGLAERLGKERVVWRYDPILFTRTYTPAYHLESLSRLARALRGLTEKCVVSLVDLYPSKNAGALSRLGAYQLPPEELDRFLRAAADIARQNGLVMAACAEDLPLERYGIEHNSCIDGALIERLIGCKLQARPDSQRPGCRCLKCEDIGAYDTCTHGCVYCYANYRPQVVAARAAGYDVSSPLLCSRLLPEDKVTVRPVRSFRKEPGEEAVQLSLF